MRDTFNDGIARTKRTRSSSDVAPPGTHENLRDHGTRKRENQGKKEEERAMGKAHAHDALR